jgi:murein DD-endopeptidase MepM/ murein hydrolase activator NlpD
VVRGAAVGLAALTTGMVFVVPASGAGDPSTQKKQVDGQLHAAAGDVADADAAVVAANNKVLAVRAKLRPAQAAVAAAQAQLATARAKYAAAKKAADAARARAEAAQRAVDAATAYLNRVRAGLVNAAKTAFVDAPEGQLDALVHATDPTSLADSLGLLQQVMNDKTTVLARVRAARQALALRAAELAKAKAEAASAEAAASAEVSRINGLLVAAQRAQAAVINLQKQEQHALDVARAAANAAKSHYDSLQAESNRLAAILAARAAAARAAAARAAAARGAPAPSYSYSGQSSGGLIMPVAGVFSSPFGWRTDPISGLRSFHPGQDIAAPWGTPIYAATGGVVSIAGWVSGYGNYTCINRDPSFATCYGHQSAIFVSVGQSVSQGQHIGNVGSTGYSTGPHLHFEVRINGQVVDPLPYLP